MSETQAKEDVFFASSVFMKKFQEALDVVAADCRDEYERDEIAQIARASILSHIRNHERSDPLDSSTELDRRRIFNLCYRNLHWA
jgi:hypothetical protein